MDANVMDRKYSFSIHQKEKMGIGILLMGVGMAMRNKMI